MECTVSLSLNNHLIEVSLRPGDEEEEVPADGIRHAVVAEEFQQAIHDGLRGEDLSVAEGAL